MYQQILSITSFALWMLDWTVSSSTLLLPNIFRKYLTSVSQSSRSTGCTWLSGIVWGGRSSSDQLSCLKKCNILLFFTRTNFHFISFHKYTYIYIFHIPPPPPPYIYIYIPPGEGGVIWKMSVL